MNFLSYETTIDRKSYDKRARFPEGTGYHLRSTKTPGPKSIVIHTTNHPKGQTLQRCAFYLYTATTVSAHYLIGKAGEIYRFLAPMNAVAWHAGNAKKGFSNNESIGIEMHWTPGEVVSEAMKDALRNLVLECCYVYGISPANVEIHRHIALPAGRKSDPDWMSDDMFRFWRADLIGNHWPKYLKLMHALERAS